VQRCPDISRARDILGWEPHVPLDTGLERTIAYFDRLLRESSRIDHAAAQALSPP
jgi:UDP-glucuronate decarboxylase